MLDQYHQDALLNHVAGDYSLTMQRAIERWTQPFILFRARLFMDGNLWCALYGDNAQEGIAGFGKTPNEAVIAFNAAWMGQPKGE